MPGPESVTISNNSMLFSAFEGLTTNRRWNKGTLVATIGDSGSVELRCVNHHILKGNGPNVVTQETDNELRNLLYTAVINELRDSFDKQLRYAASPEERVRVKKKIDEVIAKFDEVIFETGVQDGKHEFKRSDIGRIVQNVTRLKDTMSVERLLGMSADELCTLASSTDSMEKSSQYSKTTNNYVRPANRECNARDKALGLLDHEGCTVDVMVKAGNALFKKLFSWSKPLSEIQSQIDYAISSATMVLTSKKISQESITKGMKELTDLAKTYLNSNEYRNEAVDPELRKKFEAALNEFTKSGKVGTESSLRNMIELLSEHKGRLASRELGANRILKEFHIGAFRLGFGEDETQRFEKVRPDVSGVEVREDLKRLVAALASTNHAMAEKIGSLTRKEVADCLDSMNNELMAGLGCGEEDIEDRILREYKETVQQTRDKINQIFDKLDLGKITVEQLFNASKTLLDNLIPEQALIRKVRERRQALKAFLGSNHDESQIRAEIDKLMKDVAGKFQAVEFKDGPSDSRQKLEGELTKLITSGSNDSPAKVLARLRIELGDSINARHKALTAKFEANKDYSCLLQKNKDSTDVAGFIKGLKTLIMDCVTGDFHHDGVKPVIILKHDEKLVVMDKYGNSKVEASTGDNGFNLDAMLEQFVEEANAS